MLPKSLPLLAVAVAFSFITGCGSNADSEKKPDIALSPQELAIKTSEHIKEVLAQYSSQQDPWGDSTHLENADLLQQYYSETDFKTIWSKEGAWQPLADSMLTFIENARYRGLYPEHYHVAPLTSVKKSILGDSSVKMQRLDAVLWSKADILFTDAFFRLVTDLKKGRLPYDSLSVKKDSLFTSEFYFQQLATVQHTQKLTTTFTKLEPVHEGYKELIAALPAFLATAFQKQYTQVPSPKTGEVYKRALQTRLFEEGYISQDTLQLDSIALADAVKNYQKQNDLTVDGKAGDGTLRVMNTTDEDRFAQIAITLDKFKQLPDNMPARYVWVNIPGFNMYLREGDSITIQSKIIIGKAVTRTPLLTSAISELITYPQWTVPTSIIAQEILPAVKKDPGYLAKKGFSIIDKEGNEVDPYTVDWSKYTKGIPYRVVQGSGDDNALGILKFNFPNKYSVYLHDTNQRYLFAREMRSLSHGCVRVEAWDKLAQKIIQYDHKLKPDGRPSAVEDSLNSWLTQKVKKHISVKNRLPLYIRYFTAEAKNGKIRIYDDIYGDDRQLRKQFITRK